MSQGEKGLVKNLPWQQNLSLNTKLCHSLPRPGFSGVCEAEDVWEVWAAANASGRTLPPDLPLEICV